MAQRGQHTPVRNRQDHHISNPGVSGQQRQDGIRGQQGTREGPNPATDYVVGENDICSLSHHYLSWFHMGGGVKATVVMATLATSVALILVLVNISHLNVCSQMTSRVNRLESQLSTLEKQLDEEQTIRKMASKHLENRSALVSRLEGRVLTLEEHLWNRSASASRLESRVLTLEEHIRNRSTLVSRLVGSANQKTDPYKPTPSTGQIFRLVSPKGSYSYSYYGARQACAEKGAVLASYDQLYQAWLNGLDECKCGWLTDRIARYSMQRARVGCGNGIGIHMCAWQRTWDAWCYASSSGPDH